MDKSTALNQLSASLGAPVQWLDSLIQFESGWNPAAKNPYTGARGLIQFMPATARALGYKDAEDLYARNPDIISQLLGPVKDYFNLPGNRPPYPTPQSLYMTVFYPAARSWPELTPFPDTVRKVNPGITIVRDYVNKVERRKIIQKAGISLATIALVALGGYLLYTHFKKGDSNLWTDENDTPQITETE
jgi:hypothetical protein